MSIFLISNRAVENERFLTSGKERAQHSFRIATCKLDDENKTCSYDMLPEKYDHGYEYVLVSEESDDTDISSLYGTAHMFYHLYKDMVENRDKKGDVLFFIHGFSTAFEGSLDHIYQLHQLYIAPPESTIKHLVYLSWPSVKSMVFTYWNDQKDALETGRVLGRIFDKLTGFFAELFEMKKARRCKHGIHLAAHSMGNQVLKTMLETLPKENLVAIFDEVVLLHSDVPHDVFKKNEPFSILEHISNRVHIYTHRSDDALRISRFTKNLKQRLGFKGPKHSRDLGDEAFVVDTTNAREATDFQEKIIDHWGYLYRPSVVSDVLSVLAGKDEREIKNRRRNPKHSQYYKLKK